MTLASYSEFEQPFGRMLSMLGKGYLQVLRRNLQHLDIDRNYYAVVLIESYKGEITQNELATLLGTNKVTVVRIVDYLSEKGYVKRIRKAEDKRKHALVLTEKAKSALPEIKESFKQINKIAFKGLKSAQIEYLFETLRTIKTNITENNQAL